MDSPELALFRRVRAETARRIADLDQAQLDFTPRPGRWSVGEVVDHLLRAERFFRANTAELIRRARAGESRPLQRLGFAEYNPRFAFLPAAALPLLELPFRAATVVFPQPLREAVARSRLVPLLAPDFAQPVAGRAAATLRAELDASLAETERLLRDADDVDLRRLRFSHPLTGTLDAAQLVRFMARHEERHHGQIDEIVATSGFPRSRAVAGSGGPRDVTFPGPDRTSLHGVLHLPEDGTGTPRGAVVFAQCLACGKDYDAAIAIAEMLAGAGFAVLRFDFAATPATGSPFTPVSVAADVDDLHAAIGWLRLQGYGRPALIGHSMGGVACLLAAAQQIALPGVATIATFADRRGLEGILARAARPPQPGGDATLRIAGREVVVTPAFWQQLSRLQLDRVVARYPGALLVLHGTADQVVGLEQGERLFAAASQPKAFFALPGADHMLSRPQDAERAAGILTTWLAQVFADQDAVDGAEHAA